MTKERKRPISLDFLEHLKASEHSYLPTALNCDPRGVRWEERKGRGEAMQKYMIVCFETSLEVTPKWTDKSK